MFESVYIENSVNPGVTSAMNLDVTNAKNPSAWKNLRLEEEDIERCSIVVPDLADIRLGDLVVAFGDGKGIPTELGIVEGLPETLPVRGSDQREFLKQVVVLSVRQEFRQVTLGTWATGGSVFGGFSKAPLRAHVRRLIKRSGSPETTNDQVAWDLADYMTGSVSVKIGKMKEQSSNLENVKERWIPNTGEYLVLDGITLERTLKVSGVTVAAPLALSTGDYEVVISGALDRGYDAAPANIDSGNIYKNTAAMFDLVLLNETTEDTKRIGRLTPNKDELGHYYVDYTNNLSDIYNPDGSAKISSTNGVSTQTRIVWNDSLEIVGSNGEKLAIRPVSADTARAGDDLLLQFGIRKTGEKDLLTMYDPSTGTSSPAVATATEADYVAVYDKKMLWRANLYIDQKEAVLGNQDWNDAHPWNAPPDGVKTTSTPKWWSAEWGNNEWNREYDGTQTASQISSLNAGNGKQVVTLIDFTVLRSLSGTNSLANTVAYSFPDHPKEKPDDSKGDAGSMDSPFDFVWKMQRQKELLAENFDTSGMMKIEESDSYWVNTTSPQKKWTNYVKGSTNKESYIPSLGLYYSKHNTNGGQAYDEVGLEDPKSTMATSTYSWDYTFEAGTDCVGFAQRTASYCGELYKWFELPPGIMEIAATDYKSVQNGYGVDDKKRNFVRASGNYTINSWNIINKNHVDKETPANFHELQKVVPGDIWIKYKVNVDQQDLNKDSIPAHIAIVAYVPSNASELSANELMDQIILIEGEFTNKIQSVIKKLSVGDYDSSSLSVGTFIYDNYTVIDQNISTPNVLDPIDLNCTSWAIRRLK